MAKSEREKLSGDNQHDSQCKLIPDIINNNIHGIHMDPCYKRFTLILSRNKDVEDKSRSSKRLSQGSSSKFETTAQLFPEECYICKKNRVQHKGKKVYPVKVTTDDAVISIKTAAQSKNSDMYIKDMCLFAKEFKTHMHCYKEFTRGFTRKAREQLVDDKIVCQISSVFLSKH